MPSMEGDQRSAVGVEKPAKMPSIKRWYLFVMQDLCPHKSLNHTRQYATHKTVAFFL